jgi:release factor glutamine methyltransferase
MQAFIEQINQELQDLYPSTEIKSFAWLIAEKVTGMTRTQVMVNKNTTFSDAQRQIALGFVEQLKNYVPIQHLLGETEFYGLMFKVNENVLIPRPETEELVDWIITENKGKPSLKILDIGTGSGCIAISLKKHLLTSDITAFDISDGALSLAQQNAKFNGTEVIFEKQDILTAPAMEQQWDIIVSNPPYIPNKEKVAILPNVLDHEPHLALFVPDHVPLLFYRQIAIWGKNQLSPNGKIYFEIHRDFGQQTVNLLAELGYHQVVLRKDISGNDRMVMAVNG